MKYLPKNESISTRYSIEGTSLSPFTMSSLSPMTTKETPITSALRNIYTARYAFDIDDLEVFKKRVHLSSTPQSMYKTTMHVDAALYR